MAALLVAVSLFSCSRRVLVVSDPFYPATLGESTLRKELHSVASRYRAQLDFTILLPNAYATSDVVRVAGASRDRLVVLTPLLADSAEAVAASSPRKTIVVDSGAIGGRQATTSGDGRPFVTVVFDRSAAMRSAGARAVALAAATLPKAGSPGTETGTETGTDNGGAAVSRAKCAVLFLADNDERRADLKALTEGIDAAIAAGGDAKNVDFSYTRYDAAPAREHLRNDLLQIRSGGVAVLVLMLARLDPFAIDLAGGGSEQIVTENVGPLSDATPQIRASVNEPISAVLSVVLNAAKLTPGETLTAQATTATR